MLSQLGIEDERVRLEWVSAAESPKFASVVTEMINQVKSLGPSPLRKKAPGKTIEIEIQVDEPTLGG